ncbi:hypothetical protein BKA69DRAFT_641346 [Paraphysoderma sedebokerense]|nr:hypothetical protein BKA69DRAFT_641346 [Paraphysoderma sedebokerense]
MSTTVVNPDSNSKPLFHTLTIEQTTRQIETNLVDGLSKVDVANRLAQYGKNELKGQGGVSAWKVLFAQLANAMTFVLILAFALSVAVEDWIEAIVVAIVIVSNTFIGFFQEYRAEKTMESLRNLTSPTALVVRDGAQHHIPALDVVPGDIVQLKDGDVIPADMRLFEVFNLEVDEALLTGESVPVSKKTAPITNPEVSVGDRVNLAYSSTIVTKGRGKGVVINTGMSTEIGKIAKAMTEAKSRGKTVLQKRVDRLALYLLGLAIILAIIVFSVNKWVLSKDVLLYAIAVAISVIPEGLVAVMSITMSVSVREMAKQKAIVRKLTALEAVGAVSNICSDKTGTITQGKMVLRRIFLSGVGNFVVRGEGYNPVGDVLAIAQSQNLRHLNQNLEKVNGTVLTKETFPEQLARLAKVASLCNQAVLRNGRSNSSVSINIPGGNDSSKTKDNKKKKANTSLTKLEADAGWKAFGDPTECALQVFAHKVGMGKPFLSNDFEFVCEFPFESAIKRASVVLREKATGDAYVFLKGAMEQVLSKCKGVDTAAVTKEMEAIAASGLRVLAIADRKLDRSITNEDILKWKRDEADADMTFLGLVGIYDPPRPQSKNAIQVCAQAGISVHMLTGDHPKTATAIALSVGLISRAEAQIAATASTNPTPAPAALAPPAPIDLYRSITMADDERPQANIVLTAAAFDKMTDEEIDKMAHLPKVIARCTPQTKTRMVAALHRRKKVVAMTGDGVNDAPSLKAADVGIAMGMAGSDVAKQASDIVLTNDNFATIAKAVFEGRRIFNNIQKFVSHLLSTNIAEVILLIIGLAFQDEGGRSIFPMSPIQILWLNMVTSSPPAMGLGFDKASDYLQRIPPRPKSKGLFGKELVGDLSFFGTLMGILSLLNWILVIYVLGDGNMGKIGDDCNNASTLAALPGGNCNAVYRGRSVTFLSLIFMILIHAINCRHLRNLGLKGLYENKLLFWSIVFGALISIPAVYIPGTEHIFKHAPIGAAEWGLVLGSNVIFILFSIWYKYLKRRYLKPLSFKHNAEDETELEEDLDDDEDTGEYDYGNESIMKAVQ